MKLFLEDFQGGKILKIFLGDHVFWMFSTTGKGWGGIMFGQNRVWGGGDKSQGFFRVDSDNSLKCYTSLTTILSLSHCLIPLLLSISLLLPAFSEKWDSRQLTVDCILFLCLREQELSCGNRKTPATADPNTLNFSLYFPFLGTLQYFLGWRKQS